MYMLLGDFECGTKSVCNIVKSQTYEVVKLLWDKTNMHRNFRFGPIWDWLDPNGINPGPFQIRFQYILARRATKNDKLKKSRIGPIWPKSDRKKSRIFIPFVAHLTNFRSKFDIPDYETKLQCCVYHWAQDYTIMYTYTTDQGCQIWHPNWDRLAPNGTNMRLWRLLKISFSRI